MNPAVLGLLGVVGAVGITAPQLWVTLFRRSVAGLSFASICNTTVSSAVWVGYAVLEADAWLTTSSAVYTLGYAIVAVYIVKRRGSLADWPIAAFWATALVVAIFVTARTGAPAVAVALVAGPLFFGAPQVRAAWSNADTSGVSALSWSLVALDAAVWLTYGALIGLGMLVAWAIAMLVVAVAVLAGLAHSHHFRPRPDTIEPATAPLSTHP